LPHSLTAPLLAKGTVLGFLHLTNEPDDPPFTNQAVNGLLEFSQHVTQMLWQMLLGEPGAQGYLDAAIALAMIVESRSHYLSGHSRRVAKLVVQLAADMGLSDKQQEELRCVALLHNVGKIGIHPGVLAKMGRLSPQERSVIRRHPVFGQKIVEAIPFLGANREVIVQHHERCDGRGYPFGLTGDKLSLSAKILSVSDAFDAMTSERPYRKPLSRTQALKELERCAGSQFDELVTRRFVSLMSVG
jgi:HD-GYP domain-containing protein (c-di-GMP phosphodiesterase class II)